MSKLNPLWMIPFLGIAIIMAQCVFMYACPFVWLAKIVLAGSLALFLLAAIFCDKEMQ